MIQVIKIKAANIKEEFLKFLKFIKGEYLLWTVVISLSGCFLWSAFLGQHGVCHYLQLKKRWHQVQAENIALIEKNNNLAKEIYLLKNSMKYIERIAREEYGYIQKGEQVFLFP